MPIILRALYRGRAAITAVFSALAVDRITKMIEKFQEIAVQNDRESALETADDQIFAFLLYERFGIGAVASAYDKGLIGLDTFALVYCAATCGGYPATDADTVEAAEFALINTGSFFSNLFGAEASLDERTSNPGLVLKMWTFLSNVSSR